jgi:hypothetical protein
MKNIIMLTLLLLLSNIAFSQSLIIYKTDQTAVNFELSEVDSITFSVTPFMPALDLSNWECIITEPAIEKVNPAAGVFEKVAEGLKIYGNDSQLNKAVHLTSISNNPIMDKNIYLKWKADGNGNFMRVTIDLYADTTNWSAASRMINLTTNYSSEDSKVISDDMWYYTRMVVTSNSVISITSIENYDNSGSTIIQELSTHIPEPVTTFTFGTKANNASYVLLSEVRME